MPSISTEALGRKSKDTILAFRCAGELKTSNGGPKVLATQFSTA